MTQLPSVAKLNDFNVASRREKCQSTTTWVCAARIYQGIINLAVESLTLSDERSPSWET